jgi:hypothetical protein
MNAENPTRRMEYVVVKYVPNSRPTTEINVGVVLYEMRDDLLTFADCRFLKDAENLLSIDSDADVEMLDAIFRDIKRALQTSEKRDEMLGMIVGTFSNALAVSGHKAVILSSDPNVEIERLASVEVGWPTE